jgi:hypothetical protein
MKKKISIIGSLILVVLVIAFFLLKKINVVPDMISVNESFPIKYGDRGENVKKLQKFLNTKVSSGLQLDVDGIFGDQTELTLQWVFEIEKVSKDFFIQNNINNY